MFLFVIGEANFSDHGANRLGASALMQGLADGYFVAPNTVAHYLATTKLEKVAADHAEFKAAEAELSGRINRLMNVNGSRSVDTFHRELGKIMWEHCGMERTAESLQQALELIPALREEYWQDVRVPGSAADLNQSLEMALRVADFMELGELLCIDALHRNESCGGHFRSEYQTPDGEAQRDDENFAYAAAWEYKGDAAPALHKEPLQFEYVKLAQRSYK